jgi:hypothetical protein
VASETTTPTPPGAERPAYAERLGVPWYWWPLGLVLGLIPATELALASGSVIPYAILLPLTAAGLVWIGRLRVRVTADELIVDDTRLPLAVIADVIPIDANGKRELLGVSADPLAFLIVRPWIGGAVQVVVDDQDDSTPYWVISSRNPTRLAAVLAAGVLARTGPDRRTAV